MTSPSCTASKSDGSSYASARIAMQGDSPVNPGESSRPSIPVARPDRIAPPRCRGGRECDHPAGGDSAYDMFYEEITDTPDEL